MSENTKIEWCDATFNPWIGCTKVSAGCTNCYAEESMDHRYGRAKWGDNGTRVVTSDANWRKPLKWNRDAAFENARYIGPTPRPRVFCASLADVFEDRPDLDEPRFRLLRLIASTPYLDWLLLTKRPENVEPLLRRLPSPLPGFTGWDDWCQEISRTVWLGVSVENQRYADERIPHLLKTPAAVRFLSCEPLLGPVSLTHKGYIAATGDHPEMYGFMVGPDDGKSVLFKTRAEALVESGIGWVIVGGESGRDARPCEIAWIRSIVEQCQEADVPVFVKQLGANVRWSPSHGSSGEWPEHVRFHYRRDGEASSHSIILRDKKGGDSSEWSRDLRVREFPEVAAIGEATAP